MILKYSKHGLGQGEGPRESLTRVIKTFIKHYQIMTVYSTLRKEKKNVQKKKPANKCVK